MFYDGLKIIFSPPSSAMTPVRSKEGSLLTEREDIVRRWDEYFSQLLNRPSQIDRVATDNMPQRPSLKELDDPPTLEEINKAIKQLQPGKALWPDGIPPEIYKEDGEIIAAKLTELMQQF